MNKHVLDRRPGAQRFRTLTSRTAWRPVNPLLVHVGLHKTGTTYLQRCVFPNLIGAEMLTGAPMKKLLWQIRDAEPPEFDRAWVEDLGSELADRPLPVVISSEGFSAHIWNDPVGTGLRGAVRLRDLGFRTEILLTVRRQDSMLKSVYAQYVNVGGALGPEAFVRNADLGNVYDLEHLLYDRLISRYRDVFGPDHVHLLPYEEDPQDRLISLEQALRAALGPDVALGASTLEDANPSLDGAALRLLRLINANFRRSDLNPNPRIAVRGAARARRLLQRRGARLSSFGSGPTPWVFVPDRRRAEIRASNERLVGVMPSIAALGYLDLA